MASLRRATPGDIEHLVSLRLALFFEMGAGMSREQSEALGHATQRYLQVALPAEAFIAWVAEVDRHIVSTSGLVFFARPPAPGNLAGCEAYVMNMYTLPAWRNQGLATALLRELVAFVQQTDARRIWLHATLSGRPIYERAGFVAHYGTMELVW